MCASAQCGLCGCVWVSLYLFSSVSILCVASEKVQLDSGGGEDFCCPRTYTQQRSSQTVVDVCVGVLVVCVGGSSRGGGVSDTC